jgi:hypothetical protein
MVPNIVCDTSLLSNGFKDDDDDDDDNNNNNINNDNDTNNNNNNNNNNNENNNNSSIIMVIIIITWFTLGLMQMSNTGDSPLCLFVYMGCAPANIVIYPEWGVPRSQAQVVYPMPWDLQCPPIIPLGLEPYRKQPAQKEL